MWAKISFSSPLRNRCASSSSPSEVRVIWLVLFWTFSSNKNKKEPAKLIRHSTRSVFVKAAWGKECVCVRVCVRHHGYGDDGPPWRPFDLSGVKLKLIHVQRVDTFFWHKIVKDRTKRQQPLIRPLNTTRQTKLFFRLSPLVSLGEMGTVK